MLLSGLSFHPGSLVLFQPALLYPSFCPELCLESRQLLATMAAGPTWLLWRNDVNKKGKHAFPRKRERRGASFFVKLGYIISGVG